MMTLAPLGARAISPQMSQPVAKTTSPVKGSVRALEFESRKIYHSRQRPGYACWVSFFPGEKGQWYLTCEEVTRPEKPLPSATRDQWYAMGLPVGYDKSPYRMEIVMLESRDDLKTWKVISREPARFQHSAGSFGQAHAKDGRFLRFVWACYSLEEKSNPGDIFYVSEDNGRTWQKQPAFHDRRFVSYPHRLRTLRDGTLVLALPTAPAWGRGTELPLRTCSNLNAISPYQMNLCFSHDQGRTWTSPLPIYAGVSCTETDFVELPTGDLLCINNSDNSVTPGRQIIYRTQQGFVPGPFERSLSKLVPETVCITEDEVLIGCLRNSRYFWSDDLGLTWERLEGIPDYITKGKETYQPWIQYLGDGRIANAGHFGYDNAPGELDQYVMIHFFRVEVLRKSKETHIDLVREFDDAGNRWRNAYTLTLTCDGAPLPDKELEFWYVETRQPGYDSYNKNPLDERMKMGGEIIRVRTGPDGTARVAIPRLDKIEHIHHYIQLVARFNADHSDPAYKPAQTPQFGFYSISRYPDVPPQR